MNVLERLGTGTQLAGSLLLVVAASRFLYVAVTEGWADDQAPPKPASSAQVSAAPQASGPARPRGQAIRTKLLVSVGADRSTVRVDGATLGKTPLFTETSCRLGEPLSVLVIEPSGKTLTFAPICVEGTVRVDP